MHFARYFGELGSSPGDIVRSLFTQPALVFGKLFSIRSVVYALMLLVPIGCLPLLAPGRLLTAAPLFAMLCLLEFSTGAEAGSGQPVVPYHHFHAPLVPILWWAAAAALGNVGTIWRRVATRLWQGLPTLPRSATEGLQVKNPQEPGSQMETCGQRRGPVGRPDHNQAGRPDHNGVGLWPARFVCAAALATGLFAGFSPLGLSFWDSSSSWYWRELYVPGRRAELFAEVLKLIPRDARVASTDFVHPRFTHHERSYDYSDFGRAVNNGKPGAPPDTDYIVIDTGHPYSKIKSPDQIPEYHEHPEQWEVLLNDGYFIVLKRLGG